MSVDGSVAVTRVELRRVGAADLVRRDEELLRCELVRAMSDASLDRLLGAATGKRYSTGAAIFREGDASATAFLVLRGEVRFLGQAAGEQVDFGGAIRGELFGEDSAAAGKRPYSAVAFGGDVDVLEVSASALQAALAAEPSLQTLVSSLSDRRDAARREMCDFLGRW